MENMTFVPTENRFLKSWLEVAVEVAIKGRHASFGAAGLKARTQIAVLFWSLRIFRL